MPQVEGRTEFNGAWVINPPPAEHKQRAVIITGNARGGTSFAASAVANLGVPFTLSDERKETNSRYEHRELFEAFQARDAATIAEICGRFNSRYDVWGWKLPAIRYDLDLVAKTHPNPYFVLIFKEPVSIGFRKNSLKGANVLDAMTECIEGYRGMVKFASETSYPLLMIGYDSAMANLEAFVGELADFMGVSIADSQKVVEGILYDGQRYYVGRTPFDRSARKDKGAKNKKDGEAGSEGKVKERRSKAEKQAKGEKGGKGDAGEKAPAKTLFRF